ncbi:MAG TPA: DEAD/DEAH box helicase family protein [Bradyrhizobium sp.]|jgi:hypothetical protein|nr:DEAD/DEAH box helicase family protein [Bradyrhizobium sp.]
MDKRGLTERDICTKFILPAVKRAGWDEMLQVREEVYFTKGRIIVRGKLVTRGKAKKADVVLYYKPNMPIAIVEAKDNNHSVGDGIQQALDYATTLDIPFVFSSNGDGFVFHDRTGASAVKEANLGLDAFPSPANLWARYRNWKGLTPDAEQIVLQDYFDDGSGKAPRYYQVNAVNAAIEAIAKGKDRVLLVMATGTGKTYTAFQIIWRLWKAGRKKRILFLADRNVLIDQTMVNDFRPFGPAMAKLSTNAKTIERFDGTKVDLTLALDKKRRIDTAFEIYLGLYQAITGPEERQKLFREFSPGFFDLIVIDECHRGSAAADSAWREILTHFTGATQIGLTATPKETEYVSNTDYFGEPVFTYSLRQGISDGFLAPYKVIKVHIDRDVEGYRPEKGQLDREGEEIEDRIYNAKDFDRTLVLDDRTILTAKKVTQFLKESLARLNTPDPETFQADVHFALDALPALTTRPDQIKQLHQTILNLAVRGKLVPRDPNEKRVSIRYEKGLGSDGLPAHWRVLNFGKFCDIEGGNQPPKSQFINEPRAGYVRLLQIRDLGGRPVPTYIPIGSTNRFCKEGEILIGRYGASVGKVFWAQNGAYNVAMAKFIWPDDAFISTFAFLVLKSEYLQEPLARATRSAQAGFNKGDLAAIDFPLPPLGEQQRIVAKVETLMAVCDRLEASLAATAATRRRLLEALLAEALVPTEDREMEAAE